MSFETIEVSREDGRPVELLKLSFMTNNWLYTTCETPILHDGFEYVPMPMSRSEIEETGDVSKSPITVKLPEDCPVGELFRIQPPSGVVSSTIFQTHYGSADVKTIWKGRVVNAEWEFPWLCLTLESVYSSMRRIGLRQKHSVQCTHPIYSVGVGLCNVNRVMFKQTYVVSEITANVVKCPASDGLPYNYFAGGYIEWVSSENGWIERQMVTSSSGGNMTLTALPRGLSVGGTVDAYPGCDHAPDACHNKFNNSLNNGGEPYIPQKNPFGGSILY